MQLNRNFSFEKTGLVWCKCPDVECNIFFAAGLGDMAVSNTIGSNVFDILVGLGVPWALQTMCVDYGSVVNGPSCLLCISSA